MSDLRIHNGARLLICDGRKALFLINNGNPGHEDFAVEREMEQDLPSHTSDQGTDRPGLTRQMAAGTPGSAIEGTDWHRQQEEEFVRNVVAEFGKLVEGARTEQVILVAPPHALATIRKHASPDLLAKAAAQIDKDLTKHPIAEIQKILAG